MVMSKSLGKTTVLLLIVCMLSVSGVRSQVLPVLNRFSGSTFHGTVDVSWPVLFDNCTFETDSVVLSRSYGAVFRNCTFRSRTGQLYMAGSGSGMILADCKAMGCNGLMFSINPSVSDRNYVTGLTVNGDECPVPDDVESIIDIDGLELAECVKGDLKEPLFMQMSADKSTLKAGQSATLQVRGLEDGMFVGWMSWDSLFRIEVDDDFSCRVIAPDVIREPGTVLVSAYTEYGLEAACAIRYAPEQTDRESKKSRRNRKRK